MNKINVIHWNKFYQKLGKVLLKFEWLGSNISTYLDDRKPKWH